MEIFNIITKQTAESVDSLILLEYALFLRGLYPFCPHLSCELWSNLHEIIQSESPIISELFKSNDLRSDLNVWPSLNSLEFEAD